MSVRTTVKSIQDIMRQDVGVDGDAQRISQLCWMFFLKIIDDQDQELEQLQKGYRSPIPAKLQWRAWAADPEGLTGDALLAFINDKLFPTLKELSGVARDGRRRVVRDVFEDAYNYMKSGQLMRQVINKINGIDFNNLSERQHFGDIYEQVLTDLQSAGNAGEYYTPRAVTAFMADRIDPKPGEILFDPACGTGGFLTCAIRHMRERYVKTPAAERKMQGALRATEKKQLPHMLCVTNMLLHGIEDPSFVRHDNTLARPYTSYTQAERVDIVLTNPPFGGREEDGIESNFPKQFQTRETADLFLALIVRLLKSQGRAAVVLPDGTLFGEGVKTRLKEHLLEECNLHTIVRLPNSVFKPYASIGTNLLFFEKGTQTETIWFYEHRVPDGQKAYSMTRPIRFEHFKPCIDWWDKREENEVAWKVSIDDIKARGYNLDIKNPHTVEEDHGDPVELLAKLNESEAATAKLRDILKAILSEALLGPAHLLEHFDRLIDTPDAVWRLRRFILDLAVRGKLVEQNPDDEPAGELLERIRAEKTKLAKSGEIRKEKPSLSIDDSEILFEVPHTWLWSRLGDVSAYLQRGKSPKYSAGAGPLVVSQKCVQWDGLHLEWAKKITSDSLKEYEPIRFLRDGDLLWNSTGTGTIGRVIRLEAPGDCLVCDSHVTVVRCLGVDGKYIRIWLQSDYVYRTIEGRAAGATNQVELTASIALKQVTPIPPLAEQHRIVAKVSDLMTLCDELESKLNMVSTSSKALLEASLCEALENE